MERMRAALGRTRQAFSRERARAVLGRHGLPLLIVALCAFASLLALASLHPPVVISPDGKEYLAVARKIIETGQIADPRRTPGYPLFLAFIITVFPGQSLYAVVAIQLLLCALAPFEVYPLVFRMTRRPWLAGIVGAMVGLNVYMLDWAYSIRDEAFSYWLVVTLFLAVERLTRRPTPGAITAFTALSALLMVTRPFYLYLPVTLGLALLARGIALRWTRRQALAMGLALVMIYGVVGGYALLNNAVNGYPGVSYVLDVNLFGKALEYKMTHEQVPARLQRMQGQAQEFVAHGGHSPWTFAVTYGYTTNNYDALGVYARYVILHDPVRYTTETLRDMVRVTTIEPGLDARGPNTPGFIMARKFASAELRTYWALPLVLLWLAWRVRRGAWREPSLFVAMLLVLVALGAIAMTATAGYSEFYRLRSPIDWAWLTGLALVAIDTAKAAHAAWRRRERNLAGEPAAVAAGLTTRGSH